MVAQYFQGIVETNADGERYNAAWSTRWNPVIVGFYKTTSLSDRFILKKGDTIPWCAAFMNWCLAAAGLKTTAEASSGSFRDFGSETHSPSIGDIAVFQDTDPEKAKFGHGHVGIFLGLGEKRIRVLGGNQYAGKRYSAVCESSFPQNGGALKFHSYRSIASLK
jgi:uncharacterized protein (TIGR02594 family)